MKITQKEVYETRKSAEITDFDLFNRVHSEKLAIGLTIEQIVKIRLAEHNNHILTIPDGIVIKVIDDKLVSKTLEIDQQ